MEEKDIPTFDNENAREFAKTVPDKDFLDHAVLLLFNYVKAISWEIYTEGNRLGNIRSNYPTYSALCSLYMTKEQVSLAESQKLLAEQQTKIAERQEEIARGIKTSVDDSTDVAKEVRELTVTIKRLTWAMLILTSVAVVAAIASNWR